MATRTNRRRPSRRTPSRRRTVSAEARQSGRVRYAVVGLGHIAQNAVLPAFANARKNSILTALVSDDPVKLRTLGKKYKVEFLYSYDQYDELLRSGNIDAVYIALPNTMHAEYAVAAANAGIHVLTEKPMDATVEACRRMIAARDRNNIKLMVAYRLHFEHANLKAVEIARSGKLGELRMFNSVFSMSVKKGNIRLDEELGGGTLFDIGIYCINAARYLFRDEPVEVAAFSVARKDDPRFREIDEMTSVIMRYPDDRLASFISSFGAANVAYYQIVGTKGELCVDSAYEYAEKITHYLTINDKTRTKTFGRRDQFGPELVYFSSCILNGKDPEPSGEEGLKDVRIIEALYESARSGRPVKIRPPADDPDRHPSMIQEMKLRKVKQPELVHVEAPSR